MAVNESSSDLTATISFEVKNTGNYDGDEVAQLYLVDEVSSVVTPVKQLKRFERKFIKKGQTQMFRFEINKEDLKLWGIDKQWKVEKGKFTVLIGSSSEQIKLTSAFTLLKDYSF